MSVVITTYNRHGDCDETVESLLHQHVPPHEIIIIDDQSFPSYTPKTKSPMVKLIRTPRELGLGKCRTLGAKLSKGEVVAFTDDDVIIPSNWIARIIANISKGADIVGGHCRPLYAVNPPKWWNSKLFGKYMAVDNNFIVGCNFALRKNVFEQIGYFNPKLGRVANTLLSNEERCFLLRAYMSGYKTMFDPNLFLYHKVYSKKLKVSYLLRRAFYQGISIFLTIGADLRLLTVEKYLEQREGLPSSKKQSNLSFIGGVFFILLTFVTLFGYLYGLLFKRTD